MRDLAIGNVLTLRFMPCGFLRTPAPRSPLRRHRRAPCRRGGLRSAPPSPGVPVMITSPRSRLIATPIIAIHLRQFRGFHVLQMDNTHKGDPLDHLWTTQFLEQVKKRLIRPPGRMPKAHLTGSIRREVGVAGPINQHQLNLPRR